MKIIQTKTRLRLISNARPKQRSGRAVCGCAGLGYTPGTALLPSVACDVRRGNGHLSTFVFGRWCSRLVLDLPSEPAPWPERGGRLQGLGA